MPKIATPLTDKQVKALRAVGLHAVGGVPGLALQITQTPGNPLARSWVLRTMVDGVRRSIGLGSFSIVPLAQAREDAAEKLRSIRREGRDPLAEKREEKAQAAAKAARSMTFQQAAEQYIEEHRASWKSAKHADQWTATLETYAYPVIGSVQVADVDAAMVLKILKPIWTTKTETATRVRDRIKLVLDWAKVHRLRSGENPAEWKGHLKYALPSPARVKTVKHHAKLEVQDMGAFMARLRAAPGTGARALEFAILTAARSGEVRGATWAEIDLGAAVWTIPGERMKAKKEHRVPLSPAAVKLLKALPRIDGQKLVFPGSKEGKPLSDMSLTAVLRRMEMDATAHGFRGTFADWCRLTGKSEELRELSLAHEPGTKVARAYATTDALEPRRPLMNAWATFIGKPASVEVVVPIAQAKKARG